jgi:hypothetical protein
MKPAGDRTGATFRGGMSGDCGLWPETDELI